MSLGFEVFEMKAGSKSSWLAGSGGFAFVGLVACAWVSTAGVAYAYIDPNAGGLLFQILTPAFAAAAGAWILLRRWIASQVRKLAQLFRRSGSR